jgi:hypothetical protein
MNRECRPKRRRKPRPQSISILHIDRDYEAFYWIIGDGTRIMTKISLAQALELLKSTSFDLIISDPQNLAILKPSTNGCSN